MTDFEMTKVSVIGAGTVGLFLSQQLKDKCDLEIFEEHSEIGKPVQCAGLISNNIEELVKLPKECILNKVKGAKFFSPSGKVLELSRKKDEAYVIDKAKFEKFLAKDLNITLGKRIETLDLNSDYIIGADGPLSKTAKLAGFPELEEALFGIQYEIADNSYNRDFVEMYFGQETAPSFFAWIIPTKERLRVGLATEQDPKKYLDKFMKEKFKDSEILETGSGIIPVKWRDSFVKDKIALVGDSAGQVKPATGGGVYMGMRSAKILAQSIIKNDLSLYEKNWKEQILPELNYSLIIRKFMKNLSNQQMDEIWDFLNKENIKEILLEQGDMDKPSQLIQSILKEPSILKFLPYLRYVL